MGLIPVALDLYAANKNSQRRNAIFNQQQKMVAEQRREQKELNEARMRSLRQDSGTSKPTTYDPFQIDANERMGYNVNPLINMLNGGFWR